MKHLISILLITCVAHTSLYSQPRAEDYVKYPRNKVALADVNCLKLGRLGGDYGTVKIYAEDDMVNMGKPVHMFFYFPTGAPFSTYEESAVISFTTTTYAGNFPDFVESAAGKDPAYARLQKRLAHPWGVGMEFQLGNSTLPFMFAYMGCLEYAYIWGNNFLGHVTLNEALFRDCDKLRFVEFDIDHGSINKDCFLGCRSLEVIYFKQRPPDPNNMLKMFHSNYVSTSSWEYPNLKAIVVPDNNQSLWGGRDWNQEFADKVCHAVKSGSCKIMTASEFNRKRVKGISLSHSKITIKN